MFSLACMPWSHSLPGLMCPSSLDMHVVASARDRVVEEAAVEEETVLLPPEAAAADEGAWLPC